MTTMKSRALTFYSSEVIIRYVMNGRGKYMKNDKYMVFYILGTNSDGSRAILRINMGEWIIK